MMNALKINAEVILQVSLIVRCLHFDNNLVGAQFLPDSQASKSCTVLEIKVWSIFLYSDLPS